MSDIVPADGAGVDLGRVADARGVQGLVRFGQGLGRHVGLGVAEVDLGGECGEEAVQAVRPVGAHGAVEAGDGRHRAGVGRGGAHRQEAADAVAGHRDRPGVDLGQPPSPQSSEPAGGRNTRRVRRSSVRDASVPRQGLLPVLFM